MQQIVLNFEVGLSEAYETCREYVAARIPQLAIEQRKFQKVIAADMDLSPSSLTRKLAQAPGDTQRFTLDDLERYIEVTGDKKPILYLVEKHLSPTDDDALLQQIETLKAQLKGKRK
jgi:hypothetical protein